MLNDSKKLFFFRYLILHLVDTMCYVTLSSSVLETVAKPNHTEDNVLR